MGSLEKLTIGAKVCKAVLLNKLFNKRTPLMVNLFVTSKCNLRCVYCFIDFKRKLADFSKNHIFEMVDELKKMGTVLIVLLGGEPLLRDDIGEIIDYIRGKKIMCEVITNGYKFRDRVDCLKKADSICISIDGDEDHHDMSRGKGSYRVAMDALELSVSNGIQTRIHACITRNNLASLEHIAELSRKYMAPLNCAVAADHTGGNEALQFTNAEIRGFYEKLKDYKKRGYPIINATSTLDYMSNWQGSFSYVTDDANVRVGGMKLVPCKRKDFTIYIDADGALYPCATLWNKSNGLNVCNVGLGKAYDAVSELKCKSCITETEVNMLFGGNIRSVYNVFSYVIIDGIKNKFRRLLRK